MTDLGATAAKVRAPARAVTMAERENIAAGVVGEVVVVVVAVVVAVMLTANRSKGG